MSSERLAGIARSVRARPTWQLVVGGVVIGLVAILVVVAVVGPGGTSGEESSTDQTSSVPQVKTRPLEHRPGGFRLEAPRRMEVSRDQAAVRLTNKKKTLSISVAPIGAESRRAASESLTASVKGSYDEVRTGKTMKQRIHGRPATLSAGQAVNSQGTELRFVTVVLDLEDRYIGMVAFTGSGTAPSKVLPLVNEVANTIRPLPAGKSE